MAMLAIPAREAIASPSRKGDRGHRPIQGAASTKFLHSQTIAGSSPGQVAPAPRDSRTVPVLGVVSLAGASLCGRRATRRRRKPAETQGHGPSVLPLRRLPELEAGSRLRALPQPHCAGRQSVRQPEQGRPSPQHLPPRPRQAPSPESRQQPPRHQAQQLRSARATCAPAAAEVAPSEAEASELFDKLDAAGCGSISLAEIQDVIQFLEDRYASGLSASDDERLYSYLRSIPWNAGGARQHGGGLRICRGQFVLGIRSFAGLLLSLKGSSCTFEQMKIVLVAAFERFDLDSDGHLSLEELTIAARYMDLRIEEEDIAHVYRFLCPDEEAAIPLESLINARPLEEKWAEALGRSLEQMRKKRGIDGIVNLIGCVGREFATDATWGNKARRAMDIAWAGIDDVCNVVELGVDVASVAVAMQYLNESLEEALQSHAPSGLDAQALSSLDAQALLPFLTFIGAGMVQTVKDFNELVPREMTANEAQLYAQIFHPRGFSQAEFRRLLGCPGFRWASAKPGEVLHSPDDHLLRFLLRGSAEVGRSDQAHPSAVLPAGSSIGETSFLHGRCLWRREVVRAREVVFYACWDHRKLGEYLASDAELALRLDSLLTETMVANFCATLRLTEEISPRQSSLGPGGSDLASSVVDLVELGHAGHSGAVGTEEFGKQAFPDATSKGIISKRDLELLLPSLCDTLNLSGDSEKTRQRLLAYINVNKDGSVIADAVKSRLLEIEACVSSLKGLTVQELESIMFRAFRKFDLNQDGVICEEEFLLVAKKLELPLSSKQMKQLFCFFDADKDGVIQCSEWTGKVGGRLSWGDALSASLQEQAKRKGLMELLWLLTHLGDILTSPRDVAPKARLALAKVIDSSDALADAVNALSDAMAMGITLGAIWRELSGLGSWDDVSDVSLAPFLIFFSLLGVSSVRRKADGEVSDLSEAEAMLYATAFEGKGFTVTEFQSLLRYGDARWERAEAGEIVSCSSSSALKVLFSGSCKVRYAGRQTVGVIGRGQILGAARFMDLDMDEIAWALEPVQVVVLDGEALKAQIRSECLAMRLNRAVMGSMVDMLLPDNRATA